MYLEESAFFQDGTDGAGPAAVAQEPQGVAPPKRGPLLRVDGVTWMTWRWRPSRNQRWKIFINGGF